MALAGQRSLSRRSSYWIERLRLRRPESPDHSLLAQKAAVMWFASYPGPQLPASFRWFANQQVCAFHIRRVAGRQREAERPSEDIDKGRGSSLSGQHSSRQWHWLARAPLHRRHYGWP